MFYTLLASPKFEVRSPQSTVHAVLYWQVSLIHKKKPELWWPYVISCHPIYWVFFQTRSKLCYTKSTFHLSELTGQTIPIIIRISLLIKTIQPLLSNSKKYAWRNCERFEPRSHLIVRVNVVLNRTVVVDSDWWLFSKNSWKKLIATKWLVQWPWSGQPVLTLENALGMIEIWNWHLKLKP